VVGRAGTYAPDRGDIVWATFDPQAGHEQAGRRPAVVLSPVSYNRRVGLALLCPITSQEKGYPFEVALPDGLGITGVVLADQIRSIDWRARRVQHITSAPDDITREVAERLAALLPPVVDRRA
jgi:mRNA interferase MazF